MSLITTIRDIIKGRKSQDGETKGNTKITVRPISQMPPTVSIPVRPQPPVDPKGGRG